MTRLLLTVPEAAEALAISRSKLYELLTAGAVASIRIDGSRRIPITALEEYISKLLAERNAALCPLPLPLHPLTSQVAERVSAGTRPNSAMAL